MPCPHPPLCATDDPFSHESRSLESTLFWKISYIGVGLDTISIAQGEQLLGHEPLSCGTDASPSIFGKYRDADSPSQTSPVWTVPESERKKGFRRESRQGQLCAGRRRTRSFGGDLLRRRQTCPNLLSLPGLAGDAQSQCRQNPVSEGVSFGNIHPSKLMWTMPPPRDEVLRDHSSHHVTRPGYRWSAWVGHGDASNVTSAFLLHPFGVRLPESLWVGRQDRSAMGTRRRLRITAYDSSDLIVWAAPVFTAGMMVSPAIRPPTTSLSETRAAGIANRRRVITRP